MSDCSSSYASERRCWEGVGEEEELSERHRSFQVHRASSRGGTGEATPTSDSKRVTGPGLLLKGVFRICSTFLSVASSLCPITRGRT